MTRDDLTNYIYKGEIKMNRKLTAEERDARADIIIERYKGELLSKYDLDEFSDNKLLILLKISRYVEFADLDTYDKMKVLYLVDALGMTCNTLVDGTLANSIVDVDYYEVESLVRLAEKFVDEGLYGNVPEEILWYIDYELIGRKLRHDYDETSYGIFRAS